MRRVFVAEKKSVAEAIASELGVTGKETNALICGDDVVCWFFGHVFEMAQPDEYDESLKKWSLDTLPFFPINWKIKPVAYHAALIKNVHAQIKKADVVVHAGDPDAEGQLLVDEALYHWKINKPVKRIWLSSVNKASVRKALNNLKDNKDYHGLYLNALGRQRIDWMYGLNLSRLYSCIWKSKGGPYEVSLSVGRVQTPTLSSIVRREMEIEGYKQSSFFGAECLFKIKEEEIRMKWQPDPGADYFDGVCDDAGRITSRKIPEAMIKSLEQEKSGKVVEVKVDEVSEPAPLPFSLSELQKICSKRFGYSLKKTLEIAQELYDKKKILSYPRTDSGYLPESMHSTSPAIIAAIEQVLGKSCVIEGFDHSIKNRSWNDKQATPHHGIVPTEAVVQLSELSADEINVYEICAERFLLQFYKDFECLRTRMIVKIKQQYFEAGGRVILEKGWKAISQSEGEENTQALPNIEVGDEGTPVKFEVTESKTVKPVRFDSADLVEEMNRLKIGTEATRADIVDVLEKRAYVDVFKDGRKMRYRPTPLGRMMDAVLPEIMRTATLTAVIEEKLKAVEKGQAELEDVMKWMQEFLIAAVTDGVNGVGTERLNPATVGTEAMNEIKRLIAEKKAAKPATKSQTRKPKTETAT